MGYKGISKYIAVSLGMMLFLSGCQDAGTKADNESKLEESSEDVTDVEDFDAEEYFNSLLEKNKDNSDGIGRRSRRFGAAAGCFLRTGTGSGY